MKQHIGGTAALLGLLLCLCESDNLMLYMACGCLGVALMAIGAGISGAYITEKKQLVDTTTRVSEYYGRIHSEEDKTHE